MACTRSYLVFSFVSIICGHSAPGSVGTKSGLLTSMSELETLSIAGEDGFLGLR